MKNLKAQDLTAGSEASLGDVSPRDEGLYLLQDTRSLLVGLKMFWREGGGYTSNVNNAERFTKEEALRQHQSRRSDVPWPADYIESLAHPEIDVQLLREELVSPSPDTPNDEVCVLAVNIGDDRWPLRYRYRGNSIYFVGKDGKGTVNLDQARTYKKSELAAFKGIDPAPVPFVLSGLRKIQFQVVLSSICRKAMSLEEKMPRRRASNQSKASPPL